MTLQFDVPPDVFDSLAAQARNRGLSVEAFVRETILQQARSNGAADDEQARQKRDEAGARILAIQKRVKPDPEGRTARDYINFGRR